MPPGDPAEDAHETRYVSRGGLKLEAALDAFALDATGLWCADLGASTGGFTDCLLKHGAARVFSVDTAYGEFAWSLRTDDRVQVIERSNALHTSPPDDVQERGGVDLVVIDLGWTPQRLAAPAAEAWLNAGGRIITLVKPHYEQPAAEPAHEPPGKGGRGKRGGRPKRPVLDDDAAEAIARRVVSDLEAEGFGFHGLVRSPIRGGKKVKGGATGNLEWLALLTPRPRDPRDSAT